MAVAGRRPGKRDTRADILEAARSAFVQEGYERPSLRSIARRAGVDPALVHHYFDGKPALFTEALKFGRDPREIVLQMAAGGSGADLVRAFLGMWERGRPWEGGQPPFVTVAQAMSASPEAAAGMREYLEERVWSALECKEEAALDGTHLRRALITSQLIGMAWTRYVLQLEPLASAPVDLVARLIGPTLDGFMSGPLPTESGDPLAL